jgi:hypothetical protein
MDLKETEAGNDCAWGSQQQFIRPTGRDSLEAAVRRVGGWCEMAASPEAEERPLLEDVTKQSNEDRDWEH